MSIYNIDLTGFTFDPKDQPEHKREEFEIQNENQSEISLLKTIISSSEKVFLNGVLLNKNAPYDDYIVNNNKIIFNINTEIGDLLTVTYSTEQSDSV